MITACDLMTRDVFVLPEGMPVREATRRLLDHQLHGAPVVGDDGAVVGVVSLVDLARGLLYESARPGIRVGDIASRPAVTVPAAESVYSVAKRMLRNDIHRVVVSDDQRRPIGVVTPMDILRGMVNLEGAFRFHDEEPAPGER